MRRLTLTACLLLLPATVDAQLRLSPTATAGANLEAAYAMSNANDLSGKGRTATFANLATTPGKYGEAQRFNGTSSRMTIPAIPLSAAFTVEAWVLLSQNTRTVLKAPREGPAGWQAIVYRSFDNVFLAEAGGFFTAGFTSTANVFTQIISPTSLSAGGWHHVAATYDGAGLALVVDGVQVAQKAVSGAVATTTQPIEVGGSMIDGGYLGGLVDDVRVYSRGLSLADIGSDLATPVDTVADPVVAWTLDMRRPAGDVAASATFQKTGAVCNLAPLTPPVRTVENPTHARIADPAAAGKECELTIESFVLTLPIGTGYTSTAVAIGEAGTMSGRSEPSNSFDRVAIINPPATPTPAPVVR